MTDAGDPLACLADAWDAQYFYVASITLLVYDHCLTFQDEIVYFWRRQKWSGFNIFGIAFCLMRYLTFPLGAFTVLQTIYFRNTAQILRILVIVLAELILSLRTWAIWGKSRKILILLSALVVAGLVPCVIIVYKDQSNARYVGSKDCPELQRSFTKLWTAPYATVIAYEAINLSLVLYKVEKLRRGLPTIMRSPLLHILWRDGIMYFIFMFCFGLGNISILVQRSPQHFQVVFSQLQAFMHSLLVARSVFQLSKSSHDDEMNKSVLLTSCHFDVAGVKDTLVDNGWKSASQV